MLLMLLMLLLLLLLMMMMMMIMITTTIMMTMFCHNSASTLFEESVQWIFDSIDGVVKQAASGLSQVSDYKS